MPVKLGNAFPQRAPCVFLRQRLRDYPEAEFFVLQPDFEIRDDGVKQVLFGFVKVAKYYYYPGWWEGTGQGHNVVNLEKWNALPKHYQAAVSMASHDTFTWVTGKYDYDNPPALKRLMVAGAILKPFPQEVLEACYSAANEIYADLSKSNPHFGKLYSSLTAYRSDSLAWMQVAELSFDSFMMRMRTRT